MDQIPEWLMRWLYTKAIDLAFSRFWNSYGRAWLHSGNQQFMRFYVWYQVTSAWIVMSVALSLRQTGPAPTAEESTDVEELQEAVRNLIPVPDTDLFAPFKINPGLVDPFAELRAAIRSSLTVDPLAEASRSMWHSVWVDPYAGIRNTFRESFKVDPLAETRERFRRSLAVNPLAEVNEAFRKGFLVNPLAEANEEIRRSLVVNPLAEANEAFRRSLMVDPFAEIRESMRGMRNPFDEFRNTP